MATDNFNRANESPLSTNNWTTGGVFAGIYLVSNQVQVNPAGDADSWSYRTNSSVGSSAITIATAGTLEGGPAIHVDSSGNGYVVFCNGGVHITRITTGSTFVDISSSGATPSAGDVIRLYRTGSLLKVSINGVDDATAQATDSTFLGGFDGIYAFTNTLKMDNWTNGVSALIGKSVNAPGPGISPNRLAQFNNRELSTYIAPNNVTVALTGITATFTQGLLTPIRSTTIGRPLVTGPGISPDYQKLFQARNLSSTAAAVSLDVTVALTGISGTFTAGSIIPSSTVPLVGATGTFTAGALTPSASIPLGGQSGTFTAGSLTPSMSVPLVGQTGTFTTGTITTGSDVTVALTGLSATFTPGSLVPSIDVPLTGSTATFTPGTISVVGGDVTVALTGITATFTQGQLVPDGGDITGGSNPAQPAGGGWSSKFEFSANKKPKSKVKDSAYKRIEVKEQKLELNLEEVKLALAPALNKLIEADDDEALEIAEIIRAEREQIAAYLLKIIDRLN